MQGVLLPVGFYGVFTPVLVVDLVGVDYMGSALSLSTFMAGIAFIGAVPVEGTVKFC